MIAVVAALAGAALGGALAYFIAERSLHYTSDVAKADVARHEVAVLDGLVLEIEVSMELAGRASVTPLPVAYLHEVIPLSGLMNQAQLRDFQNYWQAVLRYNGRVARLIAYGAAKRARGDSPGAEKVGTTHTIEVRDAGPAARDQVRHLADERRPLADTGRSRSRMSWPFSGSTADVSKP